MVAIGLISIGVLGIATFMNYAGRAQFGIEQASQFFNLKTEIKTILSSPGTCTPNFPLADPNAYTTPQQVTLQRFDYSSGAPVAMTGPDSTIGGVGSKYGTLDILSGQVRKKQQIASNLYMMAYEISAARSAEAGGARILLSDIPFSMLVDATTGKLVRCFTDPFTVGSSNLEEFICMLTSSDQQYFDPTTQKCQSKFVTVSYPGPDPFTAGPCPTGTVFSGCAVSNGNGSGSGTPVSQSYVGYGSITSTVPGTQASQDPANPGNCKCGYSSTYVFSGTEICTIGCAKLNPMVVNIWPYQPASP
jgi:hypothetical protein